MVYFNLLGVAVCTMLVPLFLQQGEHGWSVFMALGVVLNMAAVALSLYNGG